MSISIPEFERRVQSFIRVLPNNPQGEPWTQDDINRVLLKVTTARSYTYDPALINDKLDIHQDLTNKKLEVTADVSISSFESGMQLSVDKINLPQVGKGEQNTIQIKLAIQNKASNVDVILLEEPENHLSHTNLSKLVKYIENQRQGKQLFITTHSSYVLNKLSLDKLCLINESYIRLNDIDKSVTKSLKRLPGYDTLRVVLSKNVVLVEGPSDELVLKRSYIDTNDRLPEDDGIDIIVVRGIGFKNYLEIAKSIGTNVHIVKDNDGNHKVNIEEYKKKYDAYKNIEFFSIPDKEQYSLEPVLIFSNKATEKELDDYAKITLSTQTHSKYINQKSLDDKVRFLKDWYADDGGAGKKKVDSAMRIFESDHKINYPNFLQKALRFE